MKRNKKIQIFVAYHKASKIFKNAILMPMHLGRVISDEETRNKLSKIIGDDTGENISAKNPSYAEATALYWMWKNSSADYKGLFHYRRFLNFKDSKRAFCLQDPKLISKLGISSKSANLIQDYDLLLPQITDLKDSKMNDVTIWEHYNFFHKIKDLDLALGVISEKYPHMANFAIDLANTSSKMYICNLFVAKRDVFDDAMKWLFDILFEVEKKIDISEYDDYNIRVFGFLTERLLHIYFSHLISQKKVKYKEFTVAMLYPRSEWRDK